jgi:phosphopantothenoylcysteine decarboxylase/phosphopantothenate--cysteine ligase
MRHLDLEPTEDIVTVLCRERTSQIIVGFAAETDNVMVHAKDKLIRKGLDLIVGNNVAEHGSGFGSETSAAVLLTRHGDIMEIPVVPKRVLADRILDAVFTLCQSGSDKAGKDR